VRRSDAVGRYGEEEFLLVLPCCRERNACATAHRLREVLHAAPLAAAGHVVEPYATVGVVAGLPRGLSSPEVLVLAARRALWRARRSGGPLEMATADDFSGERRRSPP
jgi:diguanylate cyclase (GGDEF)-like protein